MNKYELITKIKPNFSYLSNTQAIFIHFGFSKNTCEYKNVRSYANFKANKAKINDTAK